MLLLDPLGSVISFRTGSRGCILTNQDPRPAEQVQPLHVLGFGESIDVAYAALYFASDESRVAFCRSIPAIPLWVGLIPRTGWRRNEMKRGK
jgi:hypothetical protein